MSVGQDMITQGFQPSQGLGKDDQRIKSMIQIPTQLGRAGLGYLSGSKHRNLYKKMVIHLSTLLVPNFSSAGFKESLRKIPANVSNFLMPKVNLADDEEIDECVLVPAGEKETRNEKFLQEIQQ